MTSVQFVGMDVHADTITVAVAETAENCGCWGHSPIVWSQSGR